MNIVILGAGIVGTHIAEILSGRGHDVTLADRDVKSIARLENRIDLRCVVGDVVSFKTLSQAGVANADLLLSVTDNDAINIVAGQMSRRLGARKVIARIRGRHFLEGWENAYFEMFGIDQIFVPEQLTAFEIAKRIGTAGFFVPHSLRHSNVALQEWTISEDSPFLDTPLRDISEFEGIIIPAIFRQNQILVPSGNDRLLPRDRFYMVGPNKRIHSVSKKLLEEKPQNRVVLIYGGREIGYTLARILEQTRLSVKVVEPDENICKFLSRNLDKTLVLHGTCLEEDFMMQQGIQNVDLFAAVTPDEEDNLIASLMAKELGARETVVLSERQEYGEIMKRLGVDTTISPRLITANALLQFLAADPVKTLFILQENVAEIYEAVVAPGSELVDRSLARAKFPKGMIVAAVIRDGKVIVPGGDTVFAKNDIVMIFSLTGNLSAIKKSFY